MASYYLGQMRVFVRRVCVPGLAAMLFCCFSPALGASNDSNSTKPTLTIAQYEAELDRLSTAILTLADHPNEIRGLRESLPSGWVVTVEGAQFEISSEWLAGSLKDIEEKPLEQKTPGDQLPQDHQELRSEGGKLTETPESARRRRFKELAGQLQKMRSEAEGLAGNAQSADGASAREKLLQILSGREFQRVQGQSWFGRIWEQVERWIEWILDHTIGRLLESGPARTFILWALIGAVFLVIAVWVVRILTRMARSETLRVEGAFAPGRKWRDWAQEALSAARGGDYRTALHSAYWAGIYRLADSGAWQLDQARTPREYLRLLKNPPGREASLPVAEPIAEEARLTALAALTRSMESAWYGYIPATQQDFESAVGNLEKLGCKLGSTAQTANS